MMKIDFSVRRAYIAAMAAIGYVLAHRSASSYDWPTPRVFGAVASDTAILAILFFCFAALDRLLQPKSRVTRGHKALHFALTFLTIALATSAQALYQKTGEILDIGIIEFFFAHFDELTGAAQSAIDHEVILVAIICFGFYALSLIRVSRPQLKILQYALFASPVLLIALDYTYELIDSAEITFLPSRKAIYQGNYADLVTTQTSWLENGQPAWRQGILSGLAANAASGITEYGFIEDTATAIAAYVSPQELLSPQRTPNILFVILESTPASAIGTYSPADNIESNTPFLDILANNSWLYEYAYTTIPHTSKALVGIYCGAFAKFGTDSFESSADTYPLNCLPKLLAPLGYQNAHFQTAPGTFEGRSKFLVNAGFWHAVVQEDLNPDQQPKYGYLGLDDRLLVKPMLTWMQKQRDDGKPFFASMLTVMTHHPYSSPGNVEPLQSAAQGKRSFFKAIRYTDGVVRELLEGMKQRRLLDNTVVVITGDHGEGFAEHGQIAHNGTAYEEGMHVPLIVYAPELLPGAKRIGGLRQHIDILPSLLNLMGARHDGKLPGKDLFTDEKGHEEIITSCFYENYCLNHYRDDGTKMLYFFGKRPSEFFDLRSDPMEKDNLAPRIAPELLKARLHRAATVRRSLNQSYPD